MNLPLPNSVQHPFHVVLFSSEVHKQYYWCFCCASHLIVERLNTARQSFFSLMSPLTQKHDLSGSGCLSASIFTDFAYFLLQSQTELLATPGACDQMFGLCQTVTIGAPRLEYQQLDPFLRCWSASQRCHLLSYLSGGA